MGITFPNSLGQERVLRHAYKRANLDPNKTAYLECHGTGTPTGDPIEVLAVANGMNSTRSSAKPLILGAVKANIGHSEAVSRCIEGAFDSV
jgi:acyl transferase domain-containing protein